MVVCIGRSASQCQTQSKFCQHFQSFELTSGFNRGLEKNSIMYPILIEKISREIFVTIRKRQTRNFYQNKNQAKRGNFHQNENQSK